MKKKKKNKPPSISSNGLESGSRSHDLPHPLPGTEVYTACGGIVQYMSNTPSAVYKEEVVYFCLPICKADYEDNPKTSCLAARIFSVSAVRASMDRHRR